MTKHRTKTLMPNKVKTENVNLIQNINKNYNIISITQKQHCFIHVIVSVLLGHIISSATFADSINLIDQIKSCSIIVLLNILFYLKSTSSWHSKL